MMMMMNFLSRFSKNTQISLISLHRQPNYSMRTDGWTDMTKLIVAVHNFVNAPIKKDPILYYTWKYIKCGNRVGNNITYPILNVRHKRISVAINLRDTTQTDAASG